MSVPQKQAGERTPVVSDNKKRVASETPGDDVLRRPGASERDPARWARRRRWKERGLAALLPVAVVAAWQIMANVGLVDDRFFGSPSLVLNSGVEMIAEGELQSQSLTSITRLIVGYVIGAAFGVTIGLLMGQSRLIRVILEPTINAFYVVPKLAMLPILLMIFRGGEWPLFTLIAVAVFFIVTLGSLSAGLMVPEEYVDVARSMSISRWGLFRRVTFPGSLPGIFSTLRLAAGIGLLMLTGAEFVYGGSGLGFVIWHSWSLFHADQMYVGIVTVSITGVLFTLLIYAVERMTIPWAHVGKGGGLPKVRGV